MSSGLEEVLRDEMSARATDVPEPPDLADLVIGRAGRIRRRRRVTSATLSLLLVVGGAVSATALWDPGPPSSPTEQAAAMTDAAEELGVFSVLTDQSALLTGTGEFIDTGLADAETALEVHGGWIVNGTTTGGESTATYIGYDGSRTALATGDQVLVHSSARGDSVLVEVPGIAGDSTAALYTVTTDSKVIREGEFAYRVDEMAVGGMMGDTVWLRPAQMPEQEHEPAAQPLWYWTKALGDAPQESALTTREVEPLVGIEDNLMLARTTSSVQTDLCLATFEFIDDFSESAPRQCYSELSIHEVVVGPHGDEALGYVKPLAPTDVDPGEWVWLPFGDRAGDGLTNTGFHDPEVKPFFTYHDVAFYDPEGNWFGLDGEELGIPQLAGDPVPIHHVPGG